MTNAGRILIMPRGDWDNATSYSMLDLVTGSDNVAYLAKQPSLNIDPTTDTGIYWQTFGSAVSVDGQTIISGAGGVISVNIDSDTIRYDSGSNKVKAVLSLDALTDTNLATLADGQALIYDFTSGKWKNANIPVANLSDTAITSPVTGQALVYNGTSNKWEKQL